MRPSLPVRTNNASNNPIKYEAGTSQMQFHPPEARPGQFIMTHTIPPTHPKDGPSIIQPPFHYHIHQSEQFRVRSGIGRFYIGLDSKPTITLSSQAGAQSHAGVAAKRYHRFENASETEDLVVDIQLDPEDYENEQRFFRNFFGYLDDCKKSKTAPSLFQLMVFLQSADTPLALPLPNETLGVWVSLLFMTIVAAWGKYILGYKSNYPEYYEEGKSR